MDTVSKEVRSRIMSKIRGKNTSPEKHLRKLLRNAKIPYRTGYKIGRYRPDAVIFTKRIAIYLDGCFWHGCPRCFRAPQSNVTYWGPKIKLNKARDKKANKLLKEKGWTVVRIWEHELKIKGDLSIEGLRPQLLIS